MATKLKKPVRRIIRIALVALAVGGLGMGTLGIRRGGTVAARRARNPKGGGSIPPPATISWRALGVWRVTAYCPGPCCCGKWADGFTADGTDTRTGQDRIIAAPPGMPFGTRLYIEGVGPVVVHDRGGAIKGRRLDLFHETHGDALLWGVRNRRVWVWGTTR